MIDYTKAFAARDSRGFDKGLRDYMLKIYNYMTLALLVTGSLAFGTLNFPPLLHLMYNIGPHGEFMGTSVFGMIVTFAPLGIAIYLSTRIFNMSAQRAHTLFFVYAGLMGMSLSSLGLVYTGQSLARTFFVCSAVFGSMSLYGYTTKRDLTSMGSFLVMGLIGLIIVSLVNMYFRSPAIEFATSFIGVAIFMGLTAWDTQKIKSMYYSAGGGETGQKIAIMGAFTLYLDFINMFLFLLRFLGSRRQ
ncbi:MAG: Bax inhibitor-1/YccA family protein [Rickettsiaceae bacterium]